MSDEVRTTSSTGGQKGVKAQRYDLLPKPGLDAIAEVYAFGAEKYADHNWRKGYEWGKSYAALMRHMTAFWEGETNDPESGLPHVAHAGFHVLTLLTWMAEQGEGGEFDDRYKPATKAVESFIEMHIQPGIIPVEVASLIIGGARFHVGPYGTEDREADSMRWQG